MYLWWSYVPCITRMPGDIYRRRFKSLLFSCVTSLDRLLTRLTVDSEKNKTKKAKGGSPAATLSTVGHFGHEGQQMVTQNRQKTSKRA